MIAAIPFSGFYSTRHDDALDRALEQYFQHPGTGESLRGPFAEAWDYVNWPQAYTAYAKDYAANFCTALKIRGNFESMTSPREYNFVTDRVFITVSQREAYRIRKATPAETLAAWAKEMFTTRPGFISSYDPDVKTWGSLRGWDHNRLLCLLTAYADSEDLDLDGLMQDYNSNGEADEALARAGSEKFKRLDRAYAYLCNRYDRGDRKWINDLRT